MTIFVEDKLKPGVVGVNLADAVDIETTGPSNVQADITALNTSVTTLESNVNTLGNLGVAWNFDSGTTADPPSQTFRFNNASPFPATIIYVDKTSLTGDFSDFIEGFASGGFIFLQDATNTGNSFLFETSGSVIDQGGSGGWFEIPVTLRQTKGTFTAVNGDRFQFSFIPATGTGGGTLPNQFLSEITTSQNSVFTNKIDTEATVRFWLRTAVVTPANSNDVGTGIRIDESNGDNSDTSDTFESTGSVNNAFVYISLNDAFADATDLNTVWFVRKNSSGEVIEEINFGANFVEDTALSAVAAGEVYVSTTGFSGGGARINYFGGETLELFFRDTTDFFTISESNAPNVDLTRAVKTLELDQLGEDLTSRINFLHGNTAKDQFVLDQFVDVSTASAPGTLTGATNFYFREGAFRENSTDYFISDFDTGLPPNLGTSVVTWTVVVPHAYDISGAIGAESGMATATLVRKDVILDDLGTTFDVYSIPLPTTASATNDFFLVGTLLTITEVDPTDLFKIRRDNVQPDFLTHIENTQANTIDSQRLAALENKVSVLYALAPDIDSLTNWGEIYIPERPVQEVVITDGYDLIADYRGPTTGTERFESAGVTYDDTGTNVVTYTGLSESLQRVFGFKVDAPVNQTLLWVIDGSDRIPLIDVTSAGNYRVNNYQQARTAATPVVNEVIFLDVTAGGTRIMLSNQNAVFVVTDYPTGATETSRIVQVGFDVLLNGSDTQAEHLQQIDVPETNTPQDRIDIDIQIPLGPLHANRVVTVTVGYRFTFVDPEYRLILNLVSAPSDVTLRAQDVALTRSYTPADTVTRTDNFLIMQDAGGDYTFTGENELLVAFHPYISTGVMNVVPVATTAAGVVTQLNDRPSPIPHAGFEDVEIPDTTALAGFEFRTFRGDHILNHSDLATLITHRTVQWCYALARLRTVSTAHAVSEKLDLASGSTIGGATITGRSWQNAQSFTAASSVTVTLPTSTTLGDFVLVEATWHTGVGTATDNDNRNYTELGSMSAILNATDAELVLGGRGRGAENFGIEVTTSGLASNDTTLTLGIINLNDAGGANLPTGSLITAVRFY